MLEHREFAKGLGNLGVGTIGAPGVLRDWICRGEHANNFLKTIEIVKICLAPVRHTVLVIVPARVGFLRFGWTWARIKMLN